MVSSYILLLIRSLPSMCKSRRQIDISLNIVWRVLVVGH